MKGMNTLFAKVDLVFKDKTADEAYSTYSNFIYFNKKDNMSMNDYILEFEYLYRKHWVKSVCIPSYSGPYFPTFGLNTERYTLSLRIQSKCGKIWTRINPNTDTFCAVKMM